MPRFSDDVHDLAGEAMPVFDIPVVREDMTNLDCSLPENQNNPECTGQDLVDAGNDVIHIMVIVIILVLFAYGIIIWAAVKTKNAGLNLFLLLSLYLPFFAPISFILALLIIAGFIQ